jgi:hypothetical protein
LSYTSKYTGQEIDNKLDLIEVINQTGLVYKGVLNNTNDLDTILENGIYYYSTNNLPLNAPYENAAIVLVFGTNSTTSQKI